MATTEDYGFCEKGEVGDFFRDGAPPTTATS
jgi:hypothetical protein